MRRTFVILVIVGFLLAILAALQPPAHAASHRVKHVFFTVTSWNEKSYPVMPRWKYRHDLLDPRVSGWVKAPATAMLGAEFNSNTGEEQDARRYAHQHGYVVRTGYADTPHLRQDTLIVLRPHGLQIGRTQAAVIHGPAGGPASPSRRYVATWTHVEGFPVVFVALHLTNGCTARHRHAWWYSRRCKALHDEISTMRRFTASQHAHGETVVLGGDMNDPHVIVWGRRQAAIPVADLMQTAVVPAAGVTARLEWHYVVAQQSARGLWTDHLTPDAGFSLSR